VGHDRRAARSHLCGVESGDSQDWVEKALEWGHVREYWDDGDIEALEMVTLDATTAVENGWRPLTR
jgi:hypothetical protein